MANENSWLSSLILTAMGLLSKKTPSVSITIPLESISKTPAPIAPIYKITKAELLKGRDKQYALEYTQQISDNLDQLLMAINKIRDAYGKPMIVNSGWRPPEINAATPGAATHSKHIEGLAVDIADPDGKLMEWVLANLDIEQELNLFNEDFRWTPNWVHFQLGAPKSGKRIFVPSTAPATSPNRWNGQYDEKYNS